MRSLLLIYCLFVFQCVYAGEGEIYIDTKIPQKPIISIQLSDDLKKDLLEISGKAAYQKYLSLHLIKDKQPLDMAVSGTYQIEEDFLTFQPMTQLSGRSDYLIKALVNGNPKTKSYSTPNLGDCEEGNPKVMSVFPMTDSIPLNQFYFHIRFDQEMEPDITAYRFIDIVKEDGTVFERPWRERSYWIENNRMLVLMIHPGRTKRGIDMEEVFKKGETIKLRVNKGLRSACSRVNMETFEQPYYILERDTIVPKVLFDQIKGPSESSLHTLEGAPNQTNFMTIPFSEEMDYACLKEGVRLMKDDFEIPISGNFHTSTNELWVHIFDEMLPGKYQFVFSKIVCDLANNRLNRPFEIKDIKEMEKDQPVIWEFTIQE